MRSDGLHYCETNHIQPTLVQKVKKMSEGFSQKHMRNAKIDCEFQSKVVHPSTHDLKEIRSNNQIINFYVIVADIERSKNILAPAFPSWKAKQPAYILRHSS